MPIGLSLSRLSLREHGFVSTDQCLSELASKYDVKPWQQRISVQITAEIRSKLDFIGVDWAKDDEKVGERQIRLLDYACGTGMVSRVSIHGSAAVMVQHD